MASGSPSDNVGIVHEGALPEDASIIGTNEDAAYAKLACISKDYYKDEYQELFMQHPLQPFHADPDIKQGYWARVAAIYALVTDFCQKVDGRAQIVNVGCGYDTLYWRLTADGVPFDRVVDIDFGSTTARKIRQMLKPRGKLLKSTIAEHGDKFDRSGMTDLHCDKYHLVGADLRRVDEVTDRLKTCTESSLPTLIIAECVLIYMSSSESEALLTNLVRMFPTSAFIDFEQINTGDPFTDQMKENLRARGLSLKGADACIDAATQHERFAACHFDGVIAVFDMASVWSEKLDKHGKERVEKLEWLDEPWLREQIMKHYCLVIATTKHSVVPQL